MRYTDLYPIFIYLRYTICIEIDRYIYLSIILIYYIIYKMIYIILIMMIF